jgi:MoxR-like ATPases
MLRADHGVGKSQVARQLAKVISANEKHDFPVIDRRLSQMTEGDIVGLPATDGNVTRFCPPDWYMHACKEPCLLFLDELNRATPEVMQAAFQIVLDRTLNGHELHPQTRVIAAINIGSTYNVNEVDPALLDRFWCIDLAPSVADWLEWARSTRDNGRLDGATTSYKTNVPELICDFISAQEKWLDPAKSTDPGRVEPSRRSWDRLGVALDNVGVLDKPEDPDFYSVCLGYVGTEATIAFHDYAKNEDLHVTGQEVVESYKKSKKKLKKFTQERLNGVIDSVAEYCQTLESLTEEQGKNVAAFMETLPGELRISLWTKITAKGTEKIELAKSVHKHVVKLILDVFGVPLGAAGVNVQPTIPNFMQQQP